jgi:hypothetical protein
VAVTFGIAMALRMAGLFRQNGSEEQTLAQSGTEREKHGGRPEIPKVGQPVAAPFTELAKTRDDAARRAYDEATKLPTGQGVRRISYPRGETGRRIQLVGSMAECPT